MIADHHLDMLAASGITPEHAMLRGYKTIDDPKRLAELKIVKAARNHVPGLLVPQLRVDGSTWGYQYRPDIPRSRDGKPVKYETPVGQRNGIDVPPGVAEQLGNPEVPLWITEGVKKADCAALRGLCTVAIPGVWSWRTRNDAGGTTAVGDFNDIALNNRRVVLAFDGDVARKPDVHRAMSELARYLKSKGARAEYAHLPDTNDKTGLDDYLADHTVSELWARVHPEMPRAGSAAPPDSHEQSRSSDQRTSPDATRFFDRDGLLARELAEDVMRSVTCGVGVSDERLYIYDKGVWRPNDGRIETAIAARLGNRYRNSHARNALDLIRYSPDVARITCDPLPQYVNVRNGMIDWHSGKLLPHAPDYHSTVQLPVDYDPDAECPEFQTYLAEVLPQDCYTPDDDSPGFIWELIGYTLYSGNPLHIAVLLYGNGRNGKGTLIRLLKRLLGEQNCSTVGLHELAENRFRTATLHGKLANLAGDLDSRWLNNTAMFKAITGGDAIQGEHKYGAVFDFTPWALPFYSANKAFGSADSSEGWVASWVVVPFPTSFIGREDRQLDARLQSDAELRGILRRGVQALPMLMARGRLPEPASVVEAKSTFVTASDAVRGWLNEQCVRDPEAWTPRTNLYRAYSVHANENGAKPLIAREFYNRLEQINGIYPVKRHGDRGLTGVRLIGIRDWTSNSNSEGAEGAEGAGSFTPGRSHRGKGEEAAPSAPGEDSARNRYRPASADSNAAYVAGLCIDCKQRPHSPGRPRCEQCHRQFVHFIDAH